MITMVGKYSYVEIFAERVEATALEQIEALCNSVVSDRQRVRIMPDCHAGAGCTIGTTMTIGDKVVPNMVGVDIGCGMLVCELGKIDIDFARLDETIKRVVPCGFRIHDKAIASHSEVSNLHCYNSLINKTHNQYGDRFNRSLGTLGGGNHFIEIDEDTDGNKYLIIHSGSRNLGKQVADYYQSLAVSGCEGLDIPSDLCYLTGNVMADYLHDMKICQRYAFLNRAQIVCSVTAEMNYNIIGYWTTIHNYIDTENMILRKGAVSAQCGERLLIPLNMRDGSIIAIGKGNPEWNYSAPHGAGRTMSRSQAKKTIGLTEFKDSMDGIYTTCVDNSTIDESAFAYKPAQEIIAAIADTVEVEKIIKPIYNFKAM
jgi:RNA-splicing ligase RtcB